jgi:hypothetical protein
MKDFSFMPHLVNKLRTLDWGSLGKMAREIEGVLA